MRYTDEDKVNINESADIVKLITSRGISLEKKGRNYMCNCPFHNERTPSFAVFPGRNNYKCFGCGVSGGPISFVMEFDHLTFPEAVKKLSQEFNIPVSPVDDRVPTPEEIRDEQLRESILDANKRAAAFYEKCLYAGNDKAKFARSYVNKRWGETFAKSYGLGFAPGGTAFFEEAKKIGVSEEILKSSSLIKDVKGRLLDAFYDRVIIPIRDKFGNVLGFTARVLDDSKPKYINTSETPVFKKDHILFGLDIAIRTARQNELMYLVEGGPDVMKLQSLEILNTVGALGTAWSKFHFEQLKKICSTVCFIPDSDEVKPGQEFGIGIQTVMKSGITAIESGLKVLVKEIPSDGKKKVDADSYFTSKKVFDEVEEKEFIFWLAEKKAETITDTAARAKVAKELAGIIVNIEDKLQRELMIKSVAKLIKVSIGIFQDTVNQIAGERLRDKAKKEIQNDEDLLKFFGFYQRSNCYYGLDKDQNECRWSNFTLKPLFHIEDPRNAKRLYMLKNVTGQSRMIEFKQEELISLAKFKLKVESLGNFIWEASEKELNRLKGYLYARTETAKEILRLGWQRDGFFAFGNGVYNEGKWTEVDDLGIVRLEDKGNYYLPAFSSLYSNEYLLFDFERRFIHVPKPNAIPLRTVADHTIQVFGNNAKVSFCFLLAAIFRDVIIKYTRGEFPILNIFGPPSTGKTKLAHVLMSFFFRKVKSPNLIQSTKAALAESISQVINALVHIDEYKDFIEPDKRELIKGIWDGTGRTRINLDRDKKTESTAVDTAVILTGQEMPTADIAMFKRVIALSFSRTTFEPWEKENYNRLANEMEQGFTHLTLEILSHRKKVIDDFETYYNLTFRDLVERLNADLVEDRILKNWIIILSTFRCLENSLDFGFTYKEMLDISYNMIVEQNTNCQSQNDIARFWQIVDFLHQDGKLFIDADYRIKYEDTFKASGANKMEFAEPKPILYLSMNRVMNMYRKAGKDIGETTLPLTSLKYYLKVSNEYLGLKNAVRFKNIANFQETSVVSTKNGFTESLQTSRVDQAMCFDYLKLKEQYGINLEIETVPADEPDPIDIDTDDKQLPY